MGREGVVGWLGMVSQEKRKEIGKKRATEIYERKEIALVTE